MTAQKVQIFSIIYNNVALNVAMCDIRIMVCAS